MVLKNNFIFIMNIKKNLAIHWWDKSVNIPLPHFKWPIITENIIDAVNDILLHWKLWEYDEEEWVIFDFENMVKKYHNVKYALLNSSWTSSLFSAFFALWLKKWDEVLVPNYTFIATISPLFFFWVKMKFIDCDSELWNINIDDLKKKISDKTKAIVVTHNWWVPVDMDPILELKEKYDFKIIEDWARAIGSEYKWRKVGTIWDIWCFSFQEKKAVAWGEWGMVITNNQNYYEKMTLLWHYFKWRSDKHVKDESIKKYSDTGLWLNFWIHPLSAAIAKENFKLLDETISNRFNAIEHFKRELIINNIKSLKPSVIPEYVSNLCYYHLICFYNNWLFPKISKHEFVDMLVAEWVDIRITDNKPLNQMNIIKDRNEISFYPNDLNIDNKDCNISEEYYEKILIFPPIIDKVIFDQYILAIKKIEDYLSLQR